MTLINLRSLQPNNPISKPNMSRKFLLFCLFAILANGSMAQNDIKSAMSKQNDPKMEWWKDARFGMFIHWGPVTRMGGEISWAREGYGKAKYDSLYLKFNPINFNAREWVSIAKSSGAKYMVFTAKHCDGFCNWGTKTIQYNIMNTPFGRDVCKELADAAHEAGMPICWYFSTPDWKDPDCRHAETNDIFEQRILTQLTELLTNYGKISLLWTDFDGWAPPTSAKKFYQLAQKLQPGIIINNRLDAYHSDESHSHIGPNGDYATPEGFVAGYGAIPWETCTNLGHQWSWKWNDQPRDMREAATTLMRCVGGNGNLLLNTGPDSLGQFPANFVQRLKELGEWLKPRASSVYNTRGGPYTPAKEYVSTYNGKTIYLQVFHFRNDTLTLPPLKARIKSAMLVNGKPIRFIQGNESLKLIVPVADQEKIVTTISLETNQSLGKIGLIRPFSSNGSLAYGGKASASSSMGQFLHDPNAAFDDNPGTFWKLGRREDADFDKYVGTDLFYRGDEIKKLYHNTGWLEIDLGKKQTVSRIILNEFSFLKSEIKKFEVRYEKDGQWILIAEGTKMGDWVKEIEPVSAQKFRLQILDADGFIGISEFQLFH